MDTLNNGMQKKVNLLYSFALLLFVSIYFFRSTQFSVRFPWIYSLTPVISVFSILILFLIIFLCRTITRTSLLNFLWTSPIIFLVSYFSGNSIYLITLYLFIYCFSYVEPKRVLTSLFIALSILTLVTVLFSYVGVVENVYHWRHGVLRKSLGFKFVTYLSNFIFHLSLIYIFIRERKIKFIELMIILLVSTIVYRNTDTKSAHYFTLLLLLMVAVSKLSSRLKQLFDLFWIVGGVFVVSIVSPIVLTFYYDSSVAWYYQFNQALTGRLFLGLEAIRVFGFSLFGQRVSWILENMNSSLISSYNYVDSSYLNISIAYGVVLLLLLMIGFLHILRQKLVQNHYWSIIFMCLALHSSFDPQFLELLYNPFILFLGLALNPREELTESMSRWH